MTTSWTVIVFSLIASAFFSGMEIAFLTSNKLRIELERKQGSIAAKIFSYFIQNQSKYIGTMLVGNNIALVVFCIFMAEILAPHIRVFTANNIAVLLIETFLSTLLILVTAEFLPKSLFRINPNRIIDIFAIPVFVSYWILFPVVFITIGISEFFLKNILRVKFSEAEVTYGRVDLESLVRESTSRMSGKQELENEVKIFKKALNFSEIKVRECMVPRTEIIGIEENESIESLRQKFIDTRLSKILIFSKNIDNIIGYVHQFELFKNPSGIREILLPVLIVPETMPANEALTKFIQQRKNVAVVVDEFGGTSGMLTMEDVMEEIFGEIEDEHDKEELVEKQIGENEYVFSARMEIDYLNEKYKLNLPTSEEYETLGGLITHHHQSIPAQGDAIRIEHLVFQVLKVSDTRIEQVSLRVEAE